MADEPRDRVREILERVAAGLRLDATVEVEEHGGCVEARYVGDDLGVLIEHHGSVIDAIQHLAYRIAGQGAAERKQVSVDADGYRERRAGALRAAADQAAERAIGDGRPVRLEAMSSLERRIVHEHLKPRHDVETYSEGQEPLRRLIVAPLVS